MNFYIRLNCGIKILVALFAIGLFSGIEVVAQEREYGESAVPEGRPSEEAGAVDGAREAYEGRETLEASGTPEEGGVGAQPDEHETQWQAAAKLKARDIEELPTEQHTEKECLNLLEVQPGQMGFLDYFIFKVLDESPRELVLEGTDPTKPICVTGLDTEEIEEDQSVVVTGRIQAKGTKSYKSKSGETLKIRVIRVLGKKESEALEVELAAKTVDQPIRTWTSADGKHKTEAKFLKFENGKVHLQNQAGKIVTLSPNNLSLEDRTHYRDLVKKAREAARKALKPKEELAGE
jgi:hypothetical protein